VVVSTEFCRPKLTSLNVNYIKFHPTVSVMEPKGGNGLLIMPSFL